MAGQLSRYLLLSITSAVERRGAHLADVIETATDISSTTG